MIQLYVTGNNGNGSAATTLISLSRVDTREAMNYLLGADFKFVTAVIMIDDKPSGTPPDAEHVAQSELAYWARIADQL